MSEYCDYAYYVDTFHGTLSPDEFDRNAIMAQSYIDRAFHYTVDISALSADQLIRLKNCMCELVDVSSEASGHSGITSESIGDMSVSYAESNRYYAAKINDIIDRWLSGVFSSGRYGWV